MLKKKTTNLSGRNLKVARKLLFDVIDILEKNSIPYHLEGGTLLGIVRDKDLLPWDHDVDISVPETEVDRIIKLGPELLLKGYKFSKRKSGIEHGPIKKAAYSVMKVKPLFKYLGRIFSRRLFSDFVVLDIFVKMKDEKYTYWQAQGKVMRVDNRYYESFETIDYLGRSLRVPNHYREYLTEKYGDWSIPVKEWNCGEHEGTICS